jgi:hypothetical protein
MCQYDGLPLHSSVARSDTIEHSATPSDFKRRCVVDWLEGLTELVVPGDRTFRATRTLPSRLELRVHRGYNATQPKAHEGHIRSQTWKSGLFAANSGKTRTSIAVQSRGHKVLEVPSSNLGAPTERAPLRRGFSYSGRLS